jgi:hypothetical protein
MVDTVLIVSMIGVLTLIVERGFTWLSRIKRSKCCSNEFEFTEEKEKHEHQRKKKQGVPPAESVDSTEI